MIGGVAIECVSTEKGENGHHGRLILDFGAPMSVTGRMFGTFQGVTKDAGIQGLQVLGGLPVMVPNPYRRDLPRMNQEPSSDPDSIAYIGYVLDKLKGTLDPRRLNRMRTSANYALLRNLGIPDGVILTHYHWDHAGNISFLDQGIGIYTNHATYRILLAMQQGHPSDWRREVVMMRDHQGEKNGNEYPKAQRPYRVLPTGVSFSVGGFEIETHAVDHSAMGTQAVIVTFPNGQRVLWTADLRDGPLTQAFGEYLSTLPDGSIDIAFIDGTNIGNEKSGYSEAEVAVRIYDELLKEGPHYIMTQLRNYERWANIIAAARHAGKIAYVPLDIAYYINAAQVLRDEYPWLPAMEDIMIYLEPKKSMKFLDSDYPIARRNVIDQWRSRVVELSTIASDPEAVVLFTSQQQVEKAYHADIFKRHGQMIWSSSGVHDEKGMVDMHRFHRWLKQIGFTKEMIMLHASGHFSGEQFKEFVKQMDGKVRYLFPIHTEHPRKAADLAQKVCKKTKVRGQSGADIHQDVAYSLDTGVVDPAYLQVAERTRRQV